MNCPISDVIVLKRSWPSLDDFEDWKLVGEEDGEGGNIVGYEADIVIEDDEDFEN